MKKSLPEFNKKYHLKFEGVAYDVIYYEDGMMQSVCKAADLNHHPSRINQIKTYQINRFEICENIWCVFWSTPKVNMVYIEDYNRMIVNAILTMPDLKQIRETGTISVVE
ncbi:MAG: MoaF-related domain-containing protein [Bacteroidales bacterium]